MNLIIKTKKNKSTLFIKTTLAVLLATSATLSYADETDKITDALTLNEGLSFDFQGVKIKDVFDGDGFGVNYQTSFVELSKSEDVKKVDLYGRFNYQINYDDHKDNLTQTEIVLGINLGYSDKTHYYAEGGLMRQEIDSKNNFTTEAFNVTRLGVKHNVYNGVVVNAALEYRDGINSDTGYIIALESTSYKATSVSLGYQSVGDYQA